MSEVKTSSSSWQDELYSLVDDTGIRYAATVNNDRPFGVSKPGLFGSLGDDGARSESSESFKDQVKEFAMAWGEMLLDLGKGFKDIVQQSVITEDSFVVQKLGKRCAKVTGRLRFLNEYLPEDKDPVLAWPVIVFVFLLALVVISFNTSHDTYIEHIKKVQIHPPGASRILLPDGRYLAYNQQGVPAERARFTIMIPHPFLFSRLSGIPGVKAPLLEEFGIHLVTYDLPGFGESDAHPERNLNSSALDMQYLADAVGINGQFWVLSYSSASLHAWAALKYIPDRIAGATFIAPMINPYDPSMSKEESSKMWGKWIQRRKMIYFLARRFPKLLSSLFRHKFLSGKHGHADDWLALSLGKKDAALVQGPTFEEFWHRNVEESIRQGVITPFVEEAALLVSNWGFSLTDLQVKKKCPRNGILPWLKFMYNQAECKLTGYLSPLHVWQGMDDEVVPPSVSDYLARVLPQATIHRLPNEGHFSFFFFCDECHRQIFSTLFGTPQGPVDILVAEESETSTVPLPIDPATE